MPKVSLSPYPPLSLSQDPGLAVSNPSDPLSTPGEPSDPLVVRGKYLVDGIGARGNCHTPLRASGAPDLNPIRGRVVDAEGRPVPATTITLRATGITATTAPDGAFTFSPSPDIGGGGWGEGVLRFTGLLTAWKPGYYIAQRGVLPGDAEVELTLRSHPTGDNPDYPWIFPHRADSPPEVDYGCDTCHADVIVAQWEQNAHARTARSPRFLSMYNGTDVTGTQTVSPGFLLDFPGTAGNCANCHAPGAAVDAPFTTNMNSSDTSTYTFAAPAASIPVTVTAELRFRRAFQAVMDAKGWDVPDIVMEEAQVTLSAQPLWNAFLPLLTRK